VGLKAAAACIGRWIASHLLIAICSLMVEILLEEMARYVLFRSIAIAYWAIEVDMPHI
jgi:hypothetical protein